MRRTVLCLFAIAALGTTAGCGDDSKPSLSSDEFVRQANAICKDRNDKIKEKSAPLTAKTNPSAEEVVKFYLDDAIPNAREKLKELGELRPPDKDKEKFKKMLAAGEKALDAAEEGFKGGTSTTVRPDDKGSDVFKVSNEEFNKLTEDLKLTDCGDPK